MLRLECKGTPYEVGLQHGRGAAPKIQRSIDFYAWLFKKYTAKTWEDVIPIASLFEVQIQKKWPRYLEEMRGIADGSGCDLLDIIALNVRTEIAFGLLTGESLVSDGCTSLSWRTKNHVFLGQNWDWMEEQKDNLVLLKVECPDQPVIQMMTEAGIIGKIGMNSSGVGVCLNAVRVKGLDVTRLPVHLGLRMVLESASVAEAVAKLESIGMAGSAYFLLADEMGGIGVEFTSSTFTRLLPDEQGRLLHSNHLLGPIVSGVEELPEPDSFARMKRLTTLIQEHSQEIEWETFGAIFDDHDGFPESICRAQESPSQDASLFNIVMDLKAKIAVVKLGKPCQVEEEIMLRV